LALRLAVSLAVLALLRSLVSRFCDQPFPRFLKYSRITGMTSRSSSRTEQPNRWASQSGSSGSRQPDVRQANVKASM